MTLRVRVSRRAATRSILHQRPTPAGVPGVREDMHSIPPDVERFPDSECCSEDKGKHGCTHCVSAMA